MDNEKRVMDNEKRIDELRGYVPILRGLISYHERMTMVCIPDKNAESPKFGLDDIYLGALREGLRLIEQEIVYLQG